MTTLEATTKQYAKPEAKLKLRSELLASGGRLVYPLRKGFVVEMTRDQREAFENQHTGVRFCEIQRRVASSSDQTSTSSSSST